MPASARGRPGLERGTPSSSLPEPRQPPQLWGARANTTPARSPAKSTTLSPQPQERTPVQSPIRETAASPLADTGIGRSSLRYSSSGRVDLGSTASPYGSEVPPRRPPSVGSGIAGGGSLRDQIEEWVQRKRSDGSTTPKGVTPARRTPSYGRPMTERELIQSVDPYSPYTPGSSEARNSVTSSRRVDARRRDEDVLSALYASTGDATSNGQITARTDSSGRPAEADEVDDPIAARVQRMNRYISELRSRSGRSPAR